MKINRNIMNTLAKIAEANDEYPRARLAAAIVRNNKIVSVGINRMKTDPLQARFGKNKDAIFLHAEIHAIKNSLRDIDVEDLKDCIMYICRVKRPKSKTPYEWAIAKPCEGCNRAIAEFGLKRVIYTSSPQVCETL
jgi:tRNA(Arg) A34 adenosine deaminase TadA